jgi:hypothetical protein
MTGNFYPPFLPNFGSGPPPGNTPVVMPYFDVSTSPYTQWVFRANAWHRVGASGSGIDATSIQGVPVSATTPTSGQRLKYNGSEWAPG